MEALNELIMVTGPLNDKRTTESLSREDREESSGKINLENYDVKVERMNYSAMSS